ncbi:MAG: protein kinase [Pyrinomonadaceae bacterium]|nr:protein kinase [Pyrinomonadaceae bacterium]
MNCPQCQQVLRENARFCDGCGLSVGTLNAATERAQELFETLPPPDDPLIGHTLDAKYQLIERLGKGGMGVVYRARRVLIGDEVALKILRGELVAEDEAVGRFRREARAAAMLRHPNVVLIYDYGEARGDDAPAYIVMELVKGESLRDIIEGEDKIEIARAVSLMREICAGVGAAHRRGIVHRDIKPDNIIVLPPDEDEDRERESVKVVDFGIAKLRDPSGGGTLTQKGFQPGTVYYMSPEQCRGDDLDVRSDVYSLGAMFYEMLAGAPPFMAETRTGVISKHLFDPPRAFAEDLRVPPALEKVIMRALAKTPEARQVDATSLARELLEAERQERERHEAERQREEAKTLRLEKSAEEERLKQAAEEERRLREARTVPSDDTAKRRQERADAPLPRTEPAPPPKTDSSRAKATEEQPTQQVPTQKLDFQIPTNKAPSPDPISPVM